MAKVEFELVDSSSFQLAYAICKYYRKCNSEKELALIDLEELVEHINAYIEAERKTDRIVGGVDYER